ncbi:MAG TPA: four helix bundle protein [Thermoleophilaceae bacterium]
MAPSKFHDLDVYKHAIALADDLYARVVRWPILARSSMGEQVLRSVDSVGANIAESTGRWHTADRRRLLFIARGSLCETEHWIGCAERRGLLPLGTTERAVEIAKALNGLINSHR